MIFWSAFLLGLTGSFHCLGMCAPLLWVMPHGSKNIFGFLSSRLIYQLGRLLMYGFLGALAGLGGHAIQIEPFQSIFLGVLGLILILFALFSINPEAVTAKISILNTLSFRLSDFLGRFLKNRRNFFWAGLLNGLLPCGLVYTAMLGAVAAGNMGNGFLYMLTFGLGTLPLLLLVSLSGKPISESNKLLIRKLYPFILSLAGFLLLYKSVIGFIAWQNAEVLNCH